MTTKKAINILKILTILGSVSSMEKEALNKAIEDLNKLEKAREILGIVEEDDDLK